MRGLSRESSKISIQYIVRMRKIPESLIVPEHVYPITIPHCPFYISYWQPINVTKFLNIITLNQRINKKKTVKVNHMLKHSDKIIITHLRKDGRKNVTEIAKEVKIPATTIYDRLRLMQRKYVKRNALLLEFDKIGYPVTCYITINVKADKKDNLNSYLMDQGNVNSLFRMNYGSKVLIEGVFRSINQLDRFMEEIRSRFDVENIHADYVTEELKREAFLTDLSHFEQG